LPNSTTTAGAGVFRTPPSSHQPWLSMNRRDFLRNSANLAAGAGLLTAGPLIAQGCVSARTAGRVEPIFRISLAQWSLHRTFQSGQQDPLDFALITRQNFGIEAVEYVNTFYMDKARDAAYLRELKQRADDAGVESLLIMCDREGNLGDPDAARRTQAVENHHKWVEAAKALGCHSIRVNAGSAGSYEEQIRLAADGLRRLAEFADGHGLNVLVENHGGLSSNGAWLAAVMRAAGHPRVGTLPDFGNFRISPTESYDRYLGVEELMPFAKAISAKSNEFDERGDETGTDYRRMMRIVLDAGYRGWVGVEYEGDRLSEADGILATKRLLERLRDELTPAYS
jgi:L-ribulose-5-phosphate 3-epimerase